MIRVKKRSKTLRTELQRIMWKLGCGGVLAFTVISIIVGCESSVGPKELPGGDWTVAVTVQATDEFGIPVSVTGPIYVTLTSKDRTLSSIIPQGLSSCAFTGLPYQSYVIAAEKSGFYPANTYASGYYYNSLNASPQLVPLPSPRMKIDSIQTQVNTITPRVRLLLFTEETLPSGGSRYAVVFAGLTPQVSPRFGDYVFAFGHASQTGGSSQILTDDFYRELHIAGVVSGTLVYVTSRIATGATYASSDPETGLQLFTNLEENTRATTSFVMP